MFVFSSFTVEELGVVLIQIDSSQWTLSTE